MADDKDSALNDILEKALDEIDDEELEAGAGKGDNDDSAGAPDVMDSMPPISDKGMASAMAQLIKDMQSPPFRAAVDQAATDMSKDTDGDKKEGEEPNMSPGVGMLESDKQIAEMLKAMSEMAASAGSEGMDPASAGSLGEDMMEKMMKQFETLGAKEDFNGIVDNMMKQLLSKDVMYVPMKQICEKYPEWLAANEEELPPEEYEKYGKQYQYFQKMVATYETEPDNFPRLTELMQDMQEFGQPPAEIIKELAPGLEFGSDGMPVLPNMGAGLPGREEGGPPEQCTIM